MKRAPQPPRSNLAIEAAREDGQTMAEYSVVLTLIVLVMGIGAFVALALVVSGEFDRVTTLFSDLVP